MYKILVVFAAVLALSNVAHGHVAAWGRGMYCFGGPNPGQDNPNTNTAVDPLYRLTRSQWWFQADRGCNRVPDDPYFLELPAGGHFTVELAHNRGQTTFSHGGSGTSDWPDGRWHPEDWNGWAQDPGEGCIQDDGAMHTQSQSMAAGTAFAISYESDISRVTMENLVVFSVLPNTPWKRIATYAVPADLPMCPPSGCTCAWLWVPKGCGQPNMYMQGFKCRVTGSNSNRRLAPAQPPRFCGNNSNDCVRGAKQMIVVEQAEGNNVVRPPHPDHHVAYDSKMGFQPGAQNDIFL